MLRIGSLQNTDAQYYSNLPLIWSDGPIRVLGIEVTADMNTNSNTVNNNYNKCYEKVKRIINQWSGRDLTLLGKNSAM